MVDVIPDGGLVVALKRIFGLTQNPVTYMAVGTSANTPTSATANLGSECNGNGYQRVAVAATLDAPNKRVTAEGVFDETNITVATTLREYALYDGAAGGNMFCIGSIPTLPKDNTTSYKFKVTCTAQNIS